MSTEQKTVLDWLEENPSATPPIMTVERTTTSKFMFYLMVRHYRKRIEPKPRFFIYNKGEADTVKAIIEEHSIFDTKGAFYVLEGFSRRWVDQLHPAPKTFILAETDGGQLSAPQFFSNHANRRGILRLLIDQLGLKKNGPYTLSGLLKADWTDFRSFEDFEVYLRNAAILGMTEEDIEKDLKDNVRQKANLLTLTKRGMMKDVMDEVGKVQPQSAHNQLILTVARMLHYRSLRTMGYEPRKVAETIEVSTYVRDQLEEAHTALTEEDLSKLATRAVELDSLMLRNPELGVALFYLNNPISVRRR